MLTNVIPKTLSVSERVDVRRVCFSLSHSFLSLLSTLFLPLLSTRSLSFSAQPSLAQLLIESLCSCLFSARSLSTRFHLSLCFFLFSRLLLLPFFPVWVHISEHSLLFIELDGFTLWIVSIRSQDHERL